MFGRYSFRLLLIILLTGIRSSFAQSDALVNGLWYNEEKTAKIQVYKAVDGKYYGKIVWLKVPEREGKPKTDMNNPNKVRKNDPILGLLILRGFKKTDANEYEDGTIYDPKNGKTYSCKMNHKGNELFLRGYIGFSLIGRTTTWTKAE